MTINFGKGVYIYVSLKFRRKISVEVLELYHLSFIFGNRKCYVLGDLTEMEVREEDDDLAFSEYQLSSFGPLLTSKQSFFISYVLHAMEFRLFLSSLRSKSFSTSLTATLTS